MPRRFVVAITVFIFAFASFPLFAQEVVLKDVHVEKRPGQDSGPAMATLNGKRIKLVKEATAVWPAMASQNFIAIVEREVKQRRTYELRFYEAASGRDRVLGLVPFATGEFLEQKHGESDWTFVLAGSDPRSKEPLLIVADVNAIRARLNNASSPKLDSDSLSFRRDSESEVKLPLSDLLATGMLKIFQSANAEFVQFLHDGSAIVMSEGGRSRKGNWWTDGEQFHVAVDGAPAFSFRPQALTPATGVPADTRLVIRLVEPLSSSKAKQGDAVEAVLISPARIQGQILVPSGSKVHGKITKAHSVGWGLGHETAQMSLAIETLEFPNGAKRPFPATLFSVENAREKVDLKGAVRGIRATGTLGYSAKGQISSLAAVDPIAYLFTSMAGTGVLGFTEPEILFPAGTEMVISVREPIITSEIFPQTIGTVAGNEAERTQLQEFVKQLPFRTMTQGSNKPSDLTNLMFLGSPEALKRAFDAAGWYPASQLTAGSTFQTLKSIAGDTGYSEAPMSVLLLDEQPPLLTLSKTTNTFSARHHLRVFDPVMQFQGSKVLTSSSTQDIGIAFSRKKKTFIHVIDEYIDNERSKVINDLTFTGCVDSLELVPRPWVPLDAYNSTGDRLRTDGAIAVMRINDCSSPKGFVTGQPFIANRFQRGVRNTVLTIRNDFYRGNLVYQGITGFKKVKDFLAKGGELKPDAGAWRLSDVAGGEYEGYGELSQTSTGRPPRILSDELPAMAARTEAAAEDHRWDPPGIEISLDFGYLRFPDKKLESVEVTLQSPTAGLPSFGLGLYDRIDAGWSAGINVTLNSWRWVSNEFGYRYQRGKYRLEAYVFDEFNDMYQDEYATVGLTTRQVEYSVLVHARPKESRWRPYVAVGPALQLLSLSDSPVRRPAGPFRLGLQNIGLLKAAFDFGNTPPLEGGGIFQPALQWGAGLKWRLLPRMTIRADYRQTWSKNPDIIASSYGEYDPTDLDPSYTLLIEKRIEAGAFIKQRFTLGVGVTF